MDYTPDDIKRIRKSLKQNQTEFASTLGITRTLLNKNERGTLPISKATKILLKELENGSSKIFKELPFIIRDFHERIIRLEAHVQVYGYKLTNSAKSLSDLQEEIKEIVDKHLDELNKKSLDESESNEE